MFIQRLEINSYQIFGFTWCGISSYGFLPKACRPLVFTITASAISLSKKIGELLDLTHTFTKRKEKKNMSPKALRLDINIRFSYFLALSLVY